MFPITKENLKLMSPPKPVSSSGDVLTLIADFISEKVMELAKLGKTYYSFNVSSLLEAHHEKILDLLYYNFPDCSIDIRLEGNSISIYVDWS
jgi:hypothetical protein